ncbi:MAG: group II intron reverse transcriptase/maturase [Pseudomonadota bacterium]
MTLLDRVLSRDNLQRALKQVRQNQGAPGIDGMTVDELRGYLKQYWPEIRARLVAGNYCPKPVKRVEIPKPDGKTRPLGIPTVVDRFIQQAIAQVVSAQWEPHFHPHSYGAIRPILGAHPAGQPSAVQNRSQRFCRPNRSAHQAVREIQGQVRNGYRWVVDMDLEAFFDRVNHDRLIHRLQRHVPDRALLRLINAYLKAGVRIDSTTLPTTEGVPQGGPLSPVLANVVLDELDWELERRGHRFARYADDCNVVVKSKTAGERVMASLTRWIDKTLRLTVNERKSAVDRPWNRKFLGFTLSRGDARLKVADPSLDKLKDRIRELTRRTRGRRLIDIIAELRVALLGWKAYFGIAEVLSPEAGDRQVDTAQAPMLPVEPMGECRLSRVTQTRRDGAGSQRTPANPPMARGAFREHRL